MKNEEYININEVAKAKGLSSNRSLRIAIQKGKYIAREVTVQDVIKYIDCWIDYHNSKPCPNDSSKTIQEMLNDV